MKYSINLLVVVMGIELSASECSEASECDRAPSVTIERIGAVRPVERRLQVNAAAPDRSAFMTAGIARSYGTMSVGGASRPRYAIERGIISLEALIYQEDGSFSSVRTHGDFLKMKRRLERIREQLREFVSEKLIVFLGRTGLGKSTLLNLIAHNARIVSDDEDEFFIQIIRESGPIIGHGSISETSDLYFYKQGGRVFVDTPGLLDNRGPLQRLYNIMVIRELLRCNSVKFCLLVEEDLSGIHLYEDLKWLKSVLGSPSARDISRSTILVGSKFEQEDMGIFRNMLLRIANLRIQDYETEKGVIRQAVDLGNLFLMPYASPDLNCEEYRHRLIIAIENDSCHYTRTIGRDFHTVLRLDTASALARVIARYLQTTAYNYARRFGPASDLDGLVWYEAMHKPHYIEMIEGNILYHDVAKFLKERYLIRAVHMAAQRLDIVRAVHVDLGEQRQLAEQEVRDALIRGMFIGVVVVRSVVLAELIICLRHDILEELLTRDYSQFPQITRGIQRGIDAGIIRVLSIF